MIKKTVTYTDYNGEERTEDFYFNLTKAELLEMELSRKEGLSTMLQKAIDGADSPQLISIFKKLILKAYGQKSEDGRRFIKSEEMRNEFEQTAAYSELFTELASDDKKAEAFVNGLISGIATNRPTIEATSQKSDN